MALLTLLAVSALAIIFQRNMLGVVILAGIYSFLIATLMLVLDAVDVAMTEAAVGAGVSTVLFLATLHLTKTREVAVRGKRYAALALSLIVGAALVWGILVLPPFGTADGPIHLHVAPRYLGEALHEIHVPNVVTAVLADYRSFDTLGETTVVFTAAIAVMVLLRGMRRRPGSSDNGAEDS